MTRRREPIYEVVWPLGKSVYQISPMAHRDPNLSGKTVCEVWDSVFRGNEIFPIVREFLSSRYPGIKFVDYSHFGDTLGPQQRQVVRDLPDTLRRHGCDAVISAMGA
ncbi:MAG: hypothetical protein HYX92_15855 [Chloroflexi bacterium]|nr:hypothetical protein [Chloroflexota bacterium]